MQQPTTTYIMEHPITLSNINASFFSSHLLELGIMLTGTVIISFMAGRLFFKTAPKQKEAVKEEAEVNHARQIPQENTVSFNHASAETEEQLLTLQATVKEKEKCLHEELSESEKKLQKVYHEADVLKEEKETLLKQEKKLADYYSQQELNNLSSLKKLQENISCLEENLRVLQLQNKELEAVNEKYKCSENQQVIVCGQGTLQEGYTTPIEQELIAEQIKKLEQEKEELACKVLAQQEHIRILEAGTTNEENGTAQKGMVMQLIEKKMDALQKERDNLAEQILQLENHLKIMNLSLVSLSKIDTEIEENPIKRLTLYIRMLEGEKQGLNNKITDLSKKLNHAEINADQIPAKEVQLAHVKSRLAAIEKDKLDLQNQSGKWEVMYNKLYEKTHYLLSAKETELEQLKKTISYMEDKNRLKGSLNDLEHGQSYAGTVKIISPHSSAAPLSVTSGEQYLQLTIAGV
jgi:hypothetical protein